MEPSFIDRSDITPEDIVIIVVGVCGSGRTTLIRRLSGVQSLPETNPNSLLAHTRGVTYVRYQDSHLSARPIVLVDTPGYDGIDDAKQSMNSPSIIANASQTLAISAIIYLQKISEKNNYNVRDLLTDSGLKPSNECPVLFLTTHWDKAPGDPVACQEDLKRKNWFTSLQSLGVTTMTKLDNNETSSKGALNSFFKLRSLGQQAMNPGGDSPGLLATAEKEKEKGGHSLRLSCFS